MLLQRVACALGRLQRPFEVIVCDDGSTDDSPRLLTDAQRRYPWLRVLRMTRNGGHSAAFKRGVQGAPGEVRPPIARPPHHHPEELRRLLPMPAGPVIIPWRPLAPAPCPLPH